MSVEPNRFFAFTWSGEDILPSDASTDPGCDYILQVANGRIFGYKSRLVSPSVYEAWAEANEILHTEWYEAAPNATRAGNRIVIGPFRRGECFMQWPHPAMSDGPSLTAKSEFPSAAVPECKPATRGWRHIYSESPHWLRLNDEIPRLWFWEAGTHTWHRPVAGRPIPCGWYKKPMEAMCSVRAYHDGWRWLAAVEYAPLREGIAVTPEMIAVGLEPKPGNFFKQEDYVATVYQSMDALRPASK